MRLAGIEKGGFYPYLLHKAEACKRSGASWFIPLSARTRGRLLDPCGNEGEIASLGRRAANRTISRKTIDLVLLPCILCSLVICDSLGHQIILWAL